MSKCWIGKSTYLLGFSVKRGSSIYLAGVNYPWPVAVAVVRRDR